MNSVLWVMMICAFAHVGSALQCWKCLNEIEGVFPECTRNNPNEDPKGFTVETCKGTNAACASVHVYGGEDQRDNTIRTCVGANQIKESGVKVGECKAKEGTEGKTAYTSVSCLCDSDKCNSVIRKKNSAPFGSQSSVIAILIPAILTMIVNKF